MKLIQTVNTFNQSVPTQALINIGKVDRKVCRLDNCNRPTFNANTDSITINSLGYYLVNADFVVKSEEANAVILALIENNKVVNGTKITETYVGGDTKALSFSKIIRLERGCCKFPTCPLKLQLVNLGEGDIEISSLNFSVLKVE